MTEPERAAIAALADIVADLAEMVAHLAQMDNEGRGERAGDDIADIKDMRRRARDVSVEMRGPVTPDPLGQALNEGAGVYRP